MLSGARVVRIATHPDYARVSINIQSHRRSPKLTIPSTQMGYGARALESLNSFYSGDLLNLDEVMEEDSAETFAEAASKVDKVRHTSKLSTLLRNLSFTPLSSGRIPPCKLIA